MKRLSLLGVLLLSACVTINIYFPAAAAEKAADEIIKDIQKSSDTAVEPKASLSEWQQALYKVIDQALNVVVAPAFAQEANLSIDSPEIRKLTAQMQNRFSELKPFYDAGAIGIGSDGLLVIKDAGSVALKDRNKVTKLVAAENADRNQLYQAIANANGHPEWFAQIKSTFAGRWVGNAKSGWWYQTSGGSWKQK
ncbi:MAG: YdbL family protein [Gammaproteobacteria bacterium]